MDTKRGERERADEGRRERERVIDGSYIYLMVLVLHQSYICFHRKLYLL